MTEILTESLPLVSVVIPTYNYGHFVCEAIESALAQTYPHIEVIVVDDGSRDDTKKRLEQYGSKIRTVYQDNRGLSAARNTGIKEAKGVYIAFLDSDDIWIPKKIEQQIQAFEGKTSLGIVSCSNLEINEKGDVLGEVLKQDFKNRKELIDNLILRNVISGGSNAVVRKDCFSKIGLFDETLNSSEDWDMWLRITYHYDVKIVEAPLVKVRVSPKSMSSAPNASRMLQNELKVLDKYFSQNGMPQLQKLKAKALSYRYFCAAWAYLTSQDIHEAWQHILKSFYYSPISFFNKKQGGLMVRIILEKLLRLHIPVNGLTKPIFDLLYNIHATVREGLIAIFKFIYFEPLLRSQCQSVGEGLWMEKLPYIVGKGNIVIGSHVRLSGKSNFIFSNKIQERPQLIIGEHTFIGHNCRFAVAHEVKIGKHCLLAGGITIADNDGHPLDYLARRNNAPPLKNDVKAVSIGDDVWIGREATILKGVTVGDRAVIGAHAVVTKDVAADTIVGGNPAEVIKALGS